MPLSSIGFSVRSIVCKEAAAEIDGAKRAAPSCRKAARGHRSSRKPPRRKAPAIKLNGAPPFSPVPHTPLNHLLYCKAHTSALNSLQKNTYKMKIQNKHVYETYK